MSGSRGIDSATLETHLALVSKGSDHEQYQAALTLADRDHLDLIPMLGIDLDAVRRHRKEKCL